MTLMLRLRPILTLIMIAFLGAACSSAPHQVPSLPKRSWWIDPSTFLTSPHGRFSCSECHPDIEEKGKKHPDPQNLGRSSTRLYDYKRCEKCHAQEYERYLKGSHAKALMEKKADAPTCGDCHVAHDTALGRSRLELGRWMTERCGICHPVAKQTYLENYHGKTAVSLGYEASAYCSDCHGAHTLLSLKKKETALEACRRCHPNAGSRFTEFIIHASTEGIKKEEKDKQGKVKALQWIGLGFSVFVFAVLAFFYAHTFVWMLRKAHEWLKKD
jgi:hypothetical protein